MSIREASFGAIYYWDHEYRCSWDDHVFYSRFNTLDGVIKHYPEQREIEDIFWQSGYENLYFVAPSFTEFLMMSCDVKI